MRKFMDKIFTVVFAIAVVLAICGFIRIETRPYYGTFTVNSMRKSEPLAKIPALSTQTYEDEQVVTITSLRLDAACIATSVSQEIESEVKSKPFRLTNYIQMTEEQSEDIPELVKVFEIETTSETTAIEVEDIVETEAEIITEVETEADPVIETIGEVIEVTDEELYWLNQIVEAEAGDQDHTGRVAVVNVIINRVKYEDYFEDDIIGVIFEKNQFSPIENGYIYEVKPSSETIEAVADALAGKVVIPEGVLYFCMSYVAENSWFSTRVKWGEIGDHHFYY